MTLHTARPLGSISLLSEKPVHISARCLSQTIPSVPISFSLWTTHAALYLQLTGGVKTQCFIKTIGVALGQRPWPQPRPTIPIMHCSLSHLEASPWRSGSFSPPVPLKWSNCKKWKRQCAAICFAINNGWVSTLLKLIKLSNSSTIKTFTCSEWSWWTVHPVKIRYNRWKNWGSINRKLHKG